MRDATHDTWFGENKTDFEYPEANVEISNEQVFVEVLRTVRERARLRDRKYPTDSRWKRIVPNRSWIHTVGDEDTGSTKRQTFCSHNRPVITAAQVVGQNIVAYSKCVAACWEVSVPLGSCLLSRKSCDVRYRSRLRS